VATTAALEDALPDAERTAAGEDGAGMGLDDAVALVRRARGPRGRPSVGWASLTPTEREVVRLVAEGLSNPDIAARMFVSRATVKTHLAHVYAKLGVSNRTELAALVAARAARSR
jgi:DNA-binding CsgD family transcriptional regulator